MKLHLRGMHGLGDNLHQRALIRQLIARGDELWLETPWPCVYQDLRGPQLRIIGKGSSLRTQAKNARRERQRFDASRPPRDARCIDIRYTPADVRVCGSVLGAMLRPLGLDIVTADFRLPVPAEWASRADAIIAEWRPTRPIMLYRPLVERTEWGGCPARNPDHAAYATLFNEIRSRFFVVSVADVDPGKEWIVGKATEADAIAHRGEFSFEVLAALAARASLVYAAPGFAVILAQAVGTPVTCIFGGYENSKSFSAGRRHAPYLGIDPVDPCECFSHTHRCRKAIDLPSAKRRLMDFINATSDYSPRAA